MFIPSRRTRRRISLESDPLRSPHGSAVRTVLDIPEANSRDLALRHPPFLREGKGYNPSDLPGSYFSSLSGRSIRKSTQLSLSLRNEALKSSTFPDHTFYARSVRLDSTIWQANGEVA